MKYSYRHDRRRKLGQFHHSGKQAEQSWTNTIHILPKKKLKLYAMFTIVDVSNI